ncbi:MAG: hypothetical protein DLM65_06830, partial [Candidatus Aeolococcus gillhamiae]
MSLLDREAEGNQPPTVAAPGLKGLIVTDTEVGDVRGDEGFYHYREYAATELAVARSLDDVWRLMQDGELPTTTEEQE